MSLKIKTDEQEVEVQDGPYLLDGAVTEDGMKFIKMLVEHLPECKDRACLKLLSLYNDTWLDDDIGVISAHKFKELLVNPSISILDEIGAASVYFEDSDMFGGHFVEVALSDFEICHIGIVG